MFRSIFAIIALLVLPKLLLGASALVWEHRQLEFHPDPGDKEVKAEFHFTNNSPQPVVIDSVRSSCGCTTTGLGKKTYEAGEKGQVTALFTIGQRRGLQVKGIQVKIHGESEPTILTMITRIPELIKIEPQFVSWTMGDPITPKTIKLIVPSDSRLRLGKVTSSEASITATLETVKEGSEYRLVIGPGALDKPKLAVLTIDTVLPSNAHKAFQAYAQVKAPGMRPPVNQ